MTVLEESQALNDIANLLPTGYVKTIPFSVTQDISFEFGGVVVKMSALYFNEAMNCYFFDLSWSSDSIIYGIPVRCGLDMLSQFTTPLPNMYANNTSYPGTEVTSWRDLSLFVIDVSVLDG